jgi:hypothetical protein
MANYTDRLYGHGDKLYWEFIMAAYTDVRSWWQVILTVYNGSWYWQIIMADYTDRLYGRDDKLYWQFIMATYTDRL